MTSKSVMLAKPTESKCPLNCSFSSFLKKTPNIKGNKDAVIKYLGHNRFQLATPFNYSSSVAAAWVFLLFSLLYKVLARDCKIKSKWVLSNVGIISLMLVRHVFGSHHWHWVKKRLAMNWRVSICHGPSPRSDLDAATLIWRVMEFNCTDMTYVRPVNLRAWEKSLSSFIY